MSREVGDEPADRGVDLALRRLRSRSDFEAAARAGGSRRAYEHALGEQAASGGPWSVTGVCAVCDLAGPLRCDWISSDGKEPNWRERLVCPGCGLNNRQRFIASQLDLTRPTYLLEHVTAFAQWARGACADVVTSEYLGEAIAPGTVIDGIRHEDLMAGLSFPDRRFAQVVSNDVFEHVPDIVRALAEVARVLETGGVLWFSVPFHPLRAVGRTRAEVRDGMLHHIEEPQFHGNPVDAEAGSLVFHDFGWDLLDRCLDAGFSDAHALGYWSPLYGHLGDGLQLAFCAER